MTAPNYVPSRLKPKVAEDRGGADGPVRGRGEDAPGIDLVDSLNSSVNRRARRASTAMSSTRSGKDSSSSHRCRLATAAASSRSAIASPKAPREWQRNRASRARPNGLTVCGAA
jgi:hypothetical protein